MDLLDGFLSMLWTGLKRLGPDQPSQKINSIPMAQIYRVPQKSRVGFRASGLALGCVSGVILRPPRYKLRKKSLVYFTTNTRHKFHTKMAEKYEQFKGQPRLPKFAVPKSYDLNLKPDLVACKFAGAVDISVDIVADTKFIVLNAADLSVDRSSVRFRSQTGSKVQPLRFM